MATCRALGAFVLWVALIQLGCLAWHKLHKVESMQQLGMHCLLLTTNNTGEQPTTSALDIMLPQGLQIIIQCNRSCVVAGSTAATLSQMNAQHTTA